MPGLWPLCRLFPEDTFETDWDHGCPTSLAPNKASQLEAGILRVKKYARYVKSFHYDSPANNQSIERLQWHCLLAFLMHPRFPKPMFPNLVQITLPCFESQHTMLLAALTLSPTVRKVTVLTGYIDSPSDHELSWKALLEQLDPLSEGLDTFGITSSGGSSTAPPGVVRTVDELCKKFKVIRALSLPEGYLSQAPHELSTTLRKLELSVRNSGSPRKTMNFPNLANLELCDATVQSCKVFLQALQAPKLQHLTIRYSKRIRDKQIDLQEAFCALVASADFSHLSSITVYKDDMFCEPLRLRRALYIPSTIPITFQTLRPLLACKWLTGIDISNCVPTKICNLDLMHMLSAWPELTSLKLASTFEVDKIPELTLAGLHAALLRCPSLTHLDLPCDARTLPSANAVPHPSLLSWNVRGSPLGSSKEAARILSTCFPKLKTLRFFEDLYEKLTEPNFDTSTIDPIQVASIVRWRDVERTVSNRMA
ncbi:hypothetical protein BKA70DRAFT_1297164 [Coprinopsis sp. MPI-PUGE-AT-0042]|nr:hypothetical protein BKA70DRAFT_1297164 [Coprinopsis sp. MPI-PUGE-AT-0042]